MAASPLLLALLALAGPAFAGGVRVPSLPAKFAGTNYSGAWRAWQGPMSGALSLGRTQELLSPALQRFAPLTGTPSKKAKNAPVAAAGVAPRPAALTLLTAQLEESGFTPAQFGALEPAEQARRMQEAYDGLSAELAEHAAALAKAAQEAEAAGDAAALREAESRMSLLMASHSGYIGEEPMRSLRAARDKAFAAKSRLQGDAVDRAAREAGESLGVTGFKALGDAPDPWRGDYGGEHALTRAALFAPLRAGQVPPGFGETLAAYHRESGDGRAALEAVAPLKAYLDRAAIEVMTADVTDAKPDEGPGAGPAEALEALGHIAREAPLAMARDRAAQALSQLSFVSPFLADEGAESRSQALEALRLHMIRDAGVAAAQAEDKELASRVIKGLEAAAGPKREGEAGAALAEVEKAWKRAFGVPTPEKAKALRAKSKKQIRSGLMSLGMGAAMFWYMGTAVPSWIAWLGAWTWIFPYLPLVMGGATLLYGLFLKLRAGRA